jgi:hypothetical protein
VQLRKASCHGNSKAAHASKTWADQTVYQKDQVRSSYSPLIVCIKCVNHDLRSRLRRLASRESINARRASSTRTNAAPADHPTFPEIPEVNELRADWEFEPEQIPDADLGLGNIWTEVFRMRAPINVQGQTESSLDRTNDAGSFQSVNESERTSESDEDEVDIAINPAPGGISVALGRIRGFGRAESQENGESRERFPG